MECVIALIEFDLPRVGQVGLPLVGLLLGLSAWSLARSQLGWRRVTTLTLLRGGLLFALVLLAARPMRVEDTPVQPPSRTVMILLDRSESMALEEEGATRYSRALSFARERLLPALRAADLQPQAMLFAEDADVGADKISSAKPDGRRTNLARAIARAMTVSGTPPLAIIALTDGAATEATENAHAVAALVESRRPFIGVGFGSDTGAQTLNLRAIESPTVVPPKTAFQISARLETLGFQAGATCELLLFREGQLAQRKSVETGPGSRTWIEGFKVSEERPGAVQYSVQLLAPPVPGVKVVAAQAGTSVRVAEDTGLRVLYVQGALTWDYKFVALALRGDAGVKLTGLTRTSAQSVFRQNVESSGELMSGFPATLEELAPFRVVVLSNLRPAELSVAQQALLARYCGELGGGVLMIGGPETFDGSWQGSQLEQLLPVVFAPGRGASELERAFRLELTEPAVRHPAYQIVDDLRVREAWAKLPTFTRYGVVDAAKPGAQVWAVHSQDEGPNGRRILIASQRYGAGQTAVITVQNLWRWRLAKEAETGQFDRFWRQFFRWLGEMGRQDILIHLAEQDLRPESDVQVTLERQPGPQHFGAGADRFIVTVKDEQRKTLAEQQLELPVRRPVDFRFRAPVAGSYQIVVSDRNQVPVAQRLVEVRDVNVEFRNTARDMETLQQWAALSGGLAVRAEDCRDAGELVTQLVKRAEVTRRRQPSREPFGVSGWWLGAVLGTLAAEHLLRKKWGLR